MSTRDEFKPITKRILAFRAGHVCSNPECRLPTSGAKLGDDDGFTSIGVAAHIKAAAPGGPRYDSLQTPQERSHASNGIWLCASHAKQVDDDPSHFSVEKLQGWKQQAEERSARAILTLKAPGVATDEAATKTAAVGFAQRLGLPPQDDLTSVIARLREAAGRDLDSFAIALKSPPNAISLGLRLIHSHQVTSFDSKGLAAAIGTFNEIVLVAAPGTGKTTTLLQLARGIAEHPRLVPAFVPLREWSAQSQPLLQSIVQRAAFAGTREEHLKLLADAGLLVLVLDGWNELDSTSRKRMRSEIAGMQRDYPSLGIVMSTRSQALDAPISGPVVEIEPLSEKQQIAMARAARGGEGEQILDQAWRTAGLRDLVAIPLYLATLLANAAGSHLPTTKEEVLRLFVAEVDGKPDSSEALEAIAGGFQADMLSALATAATIADSVTVSDRNARSLISGVARRLMDDGQISVLPQPDAVLKALIDHHLLVRTNGGVEFQHQQFQEWFASHEVEMLMRAMATGDVDARQRLRVTILNAYGWEEAILFACERASRGSTNDVASAASLVLAALAVDPILAAEAIYRSSDELWATVEDEVVAFVQQWHSPGEVDRAVRFMIKTGKSAFAEAIWSFVADPSDQVHLKALRAGDRFRPSVLGKDAADRISKLAPIHRGHIVSELVMNGGSEGIVLATQVAVSDEDTQVKGAAAESLYFRRAGRELQQVLVTAPSEVWRALGRVAYDDEDLEPDVATRLRQEMDQSQKTELDPARRLNTLLRIKSSPTVAVEVQLLIETSDFSDSDRGADLILEASLLYPSEVREALLERLTRKLSIPLRAERLLREPDAAVDAGPIVELALNPDTDKRLAGIAARFLGAEATGKLIDRVLALLEKLRRSRQPAVSDEYHQVLGQISAVPIESLAAAALVRAATTDQRNIGDLAELFARHGGPEDRGPLALSEPSRLALIVMIEKWVDALLADEGTKRQVLGSVARAVERLAAPELSDCLSRMLVRDLAQWRRQRQEHLEARARGVHDSSSEAYSSWTLQYARAFVSMGGDQVIAILRSYLLDLGHEGFSLDAARALREIWRRQQGLIDHGPFNGPPEFSDVRDRRLERQSGAAPKASPVAEFIFEAINELLQRDQDSASQLHVLELAAIGLSMPYGDKRATIDCLLGLDGPSSAKQGLLTALVKSGELIEARLVLDCIAGLIEDAKCKPWLLAENQGTIDRWLVLLPFTDRPKATIEGLAMLPGSARTPWRLRPLLSALAHAPSDDAEVVLKWLGETDTRLLQEHGWFAALEERGTLPAFRILLERICAAAQDTHHDFWKFSRWLAVGMREHPTFRTDVYAKLGLPLLERAKRVLEYAVAEAPDEDGLVRLIGSYALVERGFSEVLGNALKHLVVEQRPSSEWAGAFEQVSKPAPELRKRLFDMTCATNAAEAKLAAECLVHIDELRDRYGAAFGEPRHPDIGSGAPWPMLGQSTSGHFLI